MKKILILMIVFVSLTACVFRQETPAQINEKQNLEKERTFFDFLIGDWKLEKLQTPSETSFGGRDLYKFKKSLDGDAIESEWFFNRGTKSKPNFTNGLYFSAFDNLTKIWSFYYISPTAAQYYEGKKENGNWYFYKKFNINGEEFLQRQNWKKLDQQRISREIENSKDGGRTWETVYVTILKKN